jgi:hypothetical protein
VTSGCDPGLNLLGASQLQDSNRDQIYGPHPPSQPTVEIYFGTPRSGSSECSNLHFSPECSRTQSSRSGPRIHPNQRLRSTSGLRRSGVPDAHTTFSPEVLHTQSSRSSTTRPLKSTTQVHFGTSTFRASDIPAVLFSQRAFSSRVKDRAPHVLLVRRWGSTSVTLCSTLLSPHF